MPMSNKERAALAGRASAAKLSPEERKEQMSRVRRSAAVNDILAAKSGKAMPLTPEQDNALRAAFGSR